MTRTAPVERDILSGERDWSRDALVASRDEEAARGAPSPSNGHERFARLNMKRLLGLVGLDRIVCNTSKELDKNVVVRV